MHLMYLIGFQFDEKGIARRAAQIPHEILGPNTEVECVTARNSGTVGDSYYDLAIFDMYTAEAGLRAEEQGFDALVLDTVSDSGMYILRSRLSIPVIGPGIVACCVATMLGKKFSIITMWNKWVPMYEKNLDAYHLGGKCASIRAVEVSPNPEKLFSGKEDEMNRRLTEEGQKAIEEDGADVLLLGSTTMHEAGAYMQEHLPAPVINPGPVAIKIAESIVELGLSHSKVAFPSPLTIQDEKFFSLESAGT